MKNFLCIGVLRFTVLIFILCLFSCESSSLNTSEITLTGTWFLKQEYSNEGGDTPLKEFLLSDCEKKTTLEILDNGKFIEKSYYSDLGTGGECLKDSEDTVGNWEKNPEGEINITYDENDTFNFTKSEVRIEKGYLIVTLVYDDPDLGLKTVLKFIYTKDYKDSGFNSLGSKTDMKIMHKVLPSS